MVPIVLIEPERSFYMGSIYTSYMFSFIGFFAAVFSALLFMSYVGRRWKTARRLKGLNIVTPKGGIEEDQEKDSAEWWKGIANAAGKPFQSKKIHDQISMLIRQANLPIKKDEFLGICILLSIGLTLIGWFLLNEMLLGILFGLLGFYLPFLWARGRMKKRTKAFQEQIIDMLTMTSNSLKAGYSFLQAIELISREMPAPMSEEFTRLIKETQLGVTTEESLINLSKRVSNSDLDLVITAVLIQRQIGGNLSHILDSISETIRERIKIHRDIQTLTAQGRMSSYIFRFLPLAIGFFIYIVNPGYMLALFTDPIGWILLGVAFIGQIIGSVFINKIIRIEV
jgi:tight adherence protein B